MKNGVNKVHCDSDDLFEEIFSFAKEYEIKQTFGRIKVFLGIKFLARKEINFLIYLGDLAEKEGWFLIPNKK